MTRILSYFYSIVLALLPALSIYEFSVGLSLGTFLIIVSAALPIFYNIKRSMAKEEWQLLLIILSLTFISTGYHVLLVSNWFSTTLVWHNLLVILLCFIPLIFMTNKVIIKPLITTALLIGIVASVVVAWQRLNLIATGSYNAEVYLPFFTVSRDVDNIALHRPAAFFTEPAHFCIFMLPILYMALIMRKYILALLFAFGILCSGSTTGFLMVVVITTVFLYYSDLKRKKLFTTVVIAVSVAAYALLIALYPQIILENIEKLEASDENGSSVRLLGPLAYIQYMDQAECLFGLTLNQLVNLLKSTGRFGSDVSNYANGMIFMFISYGVVGFFALVRYLLHRWRASGEAKGFIVAFLGILCSDQILFNAHFLYLSSLVILAPQIYQYCQKEYAASKKKNMLGHYRLVR